MANRIPTGRLSPRDQGAFIRMLFPSFTCGKGSKLVCRGAIRPSPLSAVYRVRIEYDGTSAPKAWMEDPEIKPREPAGDIPHTYNNERPCFFTPRFDWRPDLKIAVTVIPWLSVVAVLRGMACNGRVAGRWHASNALRSERGLNVVSNSQLGRWRN
jgi:hypothetical protein